MSEAVRDTEYQIKRMEDAIELAYLDSNLDGEHYRMLKNEWSEVKKILHYLEQDGVRNQCRCGKDIPEEQDGVAVQFCSIECKERSNKSLTAQDDK